jgi:Ca2+-binding EF-hand superfamily protein
MILKILVITHLPLYLLSNEAVIFKVYDIDGKGRVTFKDLLEVLRDLTGSFMAEQQREVLTYYETYKTILSQ